MLSTTQALDATVQTINAIHKKDPFDFGMSLGDTCNSTQYNELRWYLDVLDGKKINPSSGAHKGSKTITYQKPYQAAGLDPSLPWYQTIGNHDQLWMGITYPNDYDQENHRRLPRPRHRPARAVRRHIPLQPIVPGHPRLLHGHHGRLHGIRGRRRRGGDRKLREGAAGRPRRQAPLARSPGVDWRILEIHLEPRRPRLHQGDGRQGLRLLFPSTRRPMSRSRSSSSTTPTRLAPAIAPSTSSATIGS